MSRPKLYAFCGPARILALFDEPGVTLAPGEIHRALKANPETVSDTLARHVAAGRLVRLGNRGKFLYSLPLPMHVAADRSNPPAVRAM